MTHRPRRALPALLFLLLVLSATACPLTPYPSRHVLCDPNGLACPEQQRCVDTNDGKGFRCTRIGCGDGIVDVDVAGVDAEHCDDANSNDLDLCVACQEVVYAAEATHILGSGPGDSKANATPLGRPTALAVDLDGRIIVSSAGSNLLTQLIPAIDDGASYVVAPLGGNGTMLSSGVVAKDDRPNEMSTTFVTSLAVDTLGNVFLGDFQDSVIRRVDHVTGLVDTVVGTGIPRNAESDATPGIVTDVALPDALLIDGDGSVIFLERRLTGESSDRIRRFDRVTETVSTIELGEPLACDERNPCAAPERCLENLCRGVDRPLDDVVLDNQGRLITYERTFDTGTERVSAVRVYGSVVETSGRLHAAGPEVEYRIPRIVITGDVNIEPQRRFATNDGERFFFLADHSLVSVDVTTQPLERRVVATVPTPVTGDDTLDITGLSQGQAATSLFAITPTELVLVGDDVLVADPGNGVVWRFRQDDTNVVAGADHVVAGTLNPPSPVENVMNDVVVGFARESDGRVGVGISDDCGADVRDPFSGPAIEFYVAFPDLHRVFFSNCRSFAGVIAGTGQRGPDDALDLIYASAPLPAKETALTRPTALVRIEPTATNDVDEDAFYVADRDRGLILRLVCQNPTAVALELCGQQGFVIEPFMTEALGLPLRQPSGLAVDDRYRLLIADSGNHRVLRHDLSTGQTTVVFGTGVAGDNGDDGTATTTQLNEPTSIVHLPLSLVSTIAQLPVDLSGGLVIVTEHAGHRIRAAFLPPLPGFPQVMTLAGDGTPGDDDDPEDGRRGRVRSPRSVMFSFPDAQTQRLRFLAIDAIDRIREVAVTVNLSLVNPGLTSGLVTVQGRGGLSRDDGAFADTGLFRTPTAMAFLDADRFLVVDRATGRLRLASLSSQSVRTVAGTPEGEEPQERRTMAALTSAPLRDPTDLALQLDVEPPVVWVADDREGALRRFQLTDVDDPSTWTTDVVSVAGLVRPAGLTIDAGAVFVADEGAHAVWRVDPSTLAAVVVAGTPGTRGDAGDDGLAREALLNEPSGLALRGDALLIADTGNSRVRMVTPLSSSEATMTAFLGDGDRASGGEGAPASAFPVISPRGIDIDAQGNVIVAAGNVVRFVEASRSALAQPDDAVSTIYGKAPRDTFPEAATRCIDDVVFAPAPPGERPRIYAIDACTGLIVPLSGAAVPAGATPEAAR